MGLTIFLPFKNDNISVITLNIPRKVSGMGGSLSIKLVCSMKSMILQHSNQHKHHTSL